MVAKEGEEILGEGHGVRQRGDRPRSMGAGRSPAMPARGSVCGTGRASGTRWPGEWRRSFEASGDLVRAPANRHVNAMSSEADTLSADLPRAAAPPSPERFWSKLRRVIARVPFTEDLVAAYYCAIDRDTPAYVRTVLAGAVAYFVLPTDMVPDVLAGLGFTDDASVLAAAIAAVGRHLQPRHRAQARAALDRLAA